MSVLAEQQSQLESMNNDISNNFDKIIKCIDFSPFSNIMKQYHQKVALADVQCENLKKKSFFVSKLETSQCPESKDALVSKITEILSTEIKFK